MPRSRGPNGINCYVALDVKCVAGPMSVETPEAQQVQYYVIVFENFFDELLQKGPLSGK